MKTTEKDKTASMVLTVRSDGRTGMRLSVTELCARIGADIGDQVRVTVERIE